MRLSKWLVENWVQVCDDSEIHYTNKDPSLNAIIRLQGEQTILVDHLGNETITLNRQDLFKDIIEDQLGGKLLTLKIQCDVVAELELS